MAESIIATKMSLNRLDKGRYYDWGVRNRGLDTTHLKSLTDA